MAELGRPVVGITADRRWEEQADLFRRRGIDVLHAPTMRTIDLAGDPALREATERVVGAPPSLVVATTGAGMRAWLAAAGSWGLRDDLVAALHQATVVARGAKATSAVRQAGIEVAWRAPSESMAEVVAHVATLPAEVRRRVVVQLFDPDDHPSTAGIRSAVAPTGEVVEVPVYRWLPPADPEPGRRLVRAVVAGEVAAVTFTSQPAVRFLFSLAAEVGARDALVAAFEERGVLPVCIGAVCAEAGAEAGLTTMIWPEVFRLPPMVRLVAERLGRGQTSP